MIEVNELDQLLLQDPLSADGMLDEVVLQQVQHVRSELKVLDQTPASGPRASSEIDIERIEDLGPNGTNSPADEVIKGVRPELGLVEGGRGVPVRGRNGKDKQKDEMRWEELKAAEGNPDY